MSSVSGTTEASAMTGAAIDDPETARALVGSPTTNARGITAVVFDYGGVFSVSPFGRITIAERQLGLPAGTIVDLMGYGVDVPEPELGEDYVNKWHLLETGRVTAAEYGEWVGRRAEKLFGRPLAIADFFGRGGAMPTLWPMVHEARRLKAAGYLIGVCTNNIAEYRSSWQAQIPIGIFDDVVDSCEVGIRKPDHAIYHLTCERLGVRPDQAIFIDDHPGNVAAANEVGMHGVQVVDDDVMDAIDGIRALLRA